MSSPKPTAPATLLEALEAGDVLGMLQAQRRIMAEALVIAEDNTRPQYNLALNKLHELIAAEQARVAEAKAAKPDSEGAAGDHEVADEALDPSTL